MTDPERVREIVAETLAHMDGRLTEYAACRVSPGRDKEEGWYTSYSVDAGVLIEWLQKRGIEMVQVEK